MATANFLAADLGASNGRVLLARFDGNRFDLDVLHRFPNSVTNILGTYQWDVIRLYNEVLAGLARYAQKESAAPAGIGVDTWGVDFGLLDAKGRLLGNPVGYRDSRTDGMPEALCRAVPKAEIFELVGTHFIQFNSLIQLYAMQQQGDPQLGFAETFLFVPDLINYWMTGRKAAEYTIASTSMLLHARERRWVTELIERLGLPTHILPELVSPGTVLGPILPAIAEETGLDPSTPLLAVASHDTASAVAAVPGLDADSVYISSGTWSLTGAELPEPILSEAAMRYGFTNEGGVGGTIRFLQNFTGLWLLQSCQQQWQREGQQYSWEQLMAEAERAPAFGCLVDPDAHAFFAPGNMVAAIRTWAAESGQVVPETVGAVVRCCLESLALNTRYGIDVLQEVTGREAGSPEGPYQVVRIVGGGCQNTLLNQWIADGCNRLVVAGPVEATALGNVMMQAIATGHLGSIAEGRAAIAASVPQEKFEPRPSAAWDDAYARFRNFKKPL
jgi:rhamnulokinase